MELLLGSALTFSHNAAILRADFSSPILTLMHTQQIYSLLDRDGGNRDLVAQAMGSIGEWHGFVHCFKKNMVRCNRFGKDHSGNREFSSGRLKCQCIYGVTLKESAMEEYWPNEKSKKKSYKPLWDEIVTIKQVCSVRGGDCVPSKQNRIITMQRAGKFIDNVPKQVMYNLCNILEVTGNLPTTVIKRIVAPIFPKDKVITKNDVFGIRVKVMRLLPTYKKAHGDYELFKTAMNDSELVGGIINIADISDDKAYLMARQLWDEVMDAHSNGCSSDAIMTFADYLDIIHHKATGFSYELAQNGSGVLVVQSG